MAEEKKIIPKKKEKEINFRDLTTCDATIQMLEKAKRDGVETAFDRAVNMKACPIGADSACCKHCAMGPCRLNAKDPYGKVGVCGATIDTIMARNFARMVAAGVRRPHRPRHEHAGPVPGSGQRQHQGLQDQGPVKLEEVAHSIGIETEGREHEGHRHGPLQRTGAHLHPGGRRNSLCQAGTGKNPGNLAQSTASSPAAPCAKSWK